MKRTVGFEIITPEDAKAILKVLEERIAKGEVGQRKLSQRWVNRYANDMKHGHWLVNNQGIGFDENGLPFDGRHRLWAIAKSGVPVETVVFRGDTRQQNGILIRPVDTVDCGRPRSIAHQLQIDGMTYPSLLASVTRSIAILSRGTDDFRMSLAVTRGILELYGTHTRKLIAAGGHKTEALKGYLLAVISMYRAVNREKADVFINSYVTMVGLKEGHPILALKKYIRVHDNRSSDGVQWAIRAVALALYHYDKGNTVGTIRHSEIGSEWLLQLQKGNVKKVNEMLGVEVDEPAE